MKNRVAELRQAQHLTQEDLGQHLGVSRQTIIAIEKEKFDPALPLAFRISFYFGKKLEDIFFPH